MNAVTVRFRRREAPIPAEGVVARGEAAHALIHRLLTLEDETLRAMTGAAWDTGIVVIGPRAQLPWCDGAEYIAPTPETSRLWTDTRRRPWPHPEWIVDALRQTHPEAARFVLLSHPRTVVPLATLHRMDTSGLEHLLQTMLVT